MLERLLRNVRTGQKKLACYRKEAEHAPETNQGTSASFAPGGTIPVRFRPFGEETSPALQWTDMAAVDGHALTKGFLVGTYERWSRR
jgi:phosphatidylethanolamine-binding protein (PEBP) family uncharacterized protein